MPRQADGGTRRRLLTVAAFQPWRGSQGFAAPGLPGLGKHTRSDSQCQSEFHREGAKYLLFAKFIFLCVLPFFAVKIESRLPIPSRGITIGAHQNIGTDGPRDPNTWNGMGSGAP